MSDTVLRQQVLEDMRDSPFPQHSLHLQSYLGGRRGHVLVKAAAHSLNLSAEDYLQSLDSLPDLVFLAGTMQSRAEWTGSSKIVVAGSLAAPEQFQQSTSIHGFTTKGEEVALPASSDLHLTLLAIVPARHSLGPDPESARIAAPGKLRKTISTWKDEVTTQNMIQPPCDDCLGGGTDPSPLPGIDLGSDCNAYTITLTSEGVDQDQDGMKDGCEYRLASAFNPLLVFHRYESYDGREPYWAVNVAYGHVTVIYLLSYYYDGPPYSHNGDSEFVALRLQQNSGNNWTVSSMITSAHWNATVDNTKESFWNEIEWENASGGRPVVYVSQSHHANYESESRCDQRIGDECDPRTVGMREYAGVLPDRNIGNIEYPFLLDSRLSGFPADCTLSKGDRTRHPGVECFFSTQVQTASEGTLDDFSGWSGLHESTTHYYTVLHAYGMDVRNSSW